MSLMSPYLTNSLNRESQVQHKFLSISIFFLGSSVDVEKSDANLILLYFLEACFFPSGSFKNVLLILGVL